jgi:hypothetical protein
MAESIQPSNLEFNKKQIDDLSKSITALTRTMGYLAQSTKEEQKILKQKEKIQREQMTMEGNAIKVGETTIGHIKEENARKEANNKLWKENLKIAKENNASEDTLLEIRKQAIKQNADLKVTTEEVISSWNKFKSGKINLSQFVKEAEGIKGISAFLGTSITKMLGPVAMLAGAFKTFEFFQKQKNDFANVAGMGNEYIAPGAGRAALFASRKLSTMAGLNVTSEQYSGDITRYASMGFGRGGTETKADEYIDELQTITEQLTTAKTLFPGISQDSLGELGYLLSRNIGVPSKELANAFKTLKDNMHLSNLTTGEFFNALATVSPELIRFEGKLAGINSAQSEINKYDKLLKDRVLSSSDINKSTTSPMIASTNQMGMALTLAKRSGVGMDGISDNDSLFVQINKLRMNMIKDKSLPYRLQEYGYKNMGLLSGVSGDDYYRSLYEMIRGGAANLSIPGTELLTSGKMNVSQFEDVLKTGRMSLGGGIGGGEDLYQRTKKKVQANLGTAGILKNKLIETISDFEDYSSNPESYSKRVMNERVGQKSYPEILMDSVVKGLNGIADKIDADSKKQMTGTLTIVEEGRNRNANADIKRK